MKKVYRKLHLWLSVPFGVFITLICFSGSMLVFEKEITESCRRDLYFVAETGGEPLPLDRLAESVAASLPDSVSVTGITVSSDPSRAYQVSLSKPRRASIYVDQYTGEIKGKNERLPFFDTMFHLHRWLLGSSDGNGGVAWGKLLVGLSTLALVIILLTGLLMWLTNRNKPLKKSLTISFSKGWPRFWHDLHVAGGIYATIFLLALALTGLTWSFSWYRTGFYKVFGVETSADSGHGGGRNVAAVATEGHGGRPSGNGEERRNAGAEAGRGDARRNADAETGRDDGRRSADAESGRGRRGGDAATGGEERREHRGRDGAGEDHTAHSGFHGRHGADTVEVAHAGRPHRHSPFARWQEVYDGLIRMYPDYRQITLSAGSASIVPAGRMSLRAGDRFDFDSESGEIVGKLPYAEQERSAKVRGSVYTVHVGSWGGWITRILTFLSAILGATLPLTGYYLWIRRLIKGHPHRSPNCAGR